MSDDTEGTDSLDALLAGDSGEAAPASAADAAQQVLNTDEGRAAVAEVAAKEASAQEQYLHSPAGKADVQHSSDVREALAAAGEGDYDPIGRIAMQQEGQRQRQGEVDAAASEGADTKMAETIQEMYGDQLKAMKPEEVKALDDIPLSEAIQKLASLKAGGTGASKAGPTSEAQAGVDRGAGWDSEMEAGFASLGKAVREQIGEGD